YDGSIELIGIFVEPRYGIYVGSDKVAPYLSGRLAFARLDLRNDTNDGDVITWASNGVTLNGGGGILIRVSQRANLDFGAPAGFYELRFSARAHHPKHIRSSAGLGDESGRARGSGDRPRQVTPASRARRSLSCGSWTGSSCLLLIPRPRGMWRAPQRYRL